MRRRLNLACAVVHDPELLLLDEPTALVDPQSRRHVYDALAELKAHRRTILHSTHHMDEAELLCDRIAILDRGRLLALDTVDALVDRHGGAEDVPTKTSERSVGLASVFFSLTGRDLRD